MVSMTTVSELPTRNTTVSATRISGIARRQEMMNSTTELIHPPKYPPTTPSVVPIRPERMTVVMPISSEMRTPSSRRDR